MFLVFNQLLLFVASIKLGYQAYFSKVPDGLRLGLALKFRAQIKEKGITNESNRFIQILAY